jgi:hypothetical protein
MACAGIAGAILGMAAAPSGAAERGKFRGTAVLFNTQFQQIAAPEGNPGGAVMMGEMEGLVFNDARKPFLDKAHYHVVWKADGRGNGDCFKTFTMAGGDKLFARCDGKATGNGFDGTIELMGGTGAYAGAKGRGSYKLVNVSERVMWDVLEWDYELP